MKSKNLIETLAKSISVSLPSPENIKPDLTLKITEKLFGTEDFSALGYYAGKYKGKNLNFIFKTQPNKECINALSSSLSIFKIKFSIGLKSETEVEIGYPEIDTIYRKFKSELEPDIIILGFPFASSQEFQKISRMLKGKSVPAGIDLLVFTKEEIREKLELDLFEGDIKRAGGKTITEATDLSEFENKTFKCLLTNSAAAAHKAQELGVEANFKTMEELIQSLK